MPSGCTGCCRYLKDLPKKVEEGACECEVGVGYIVTMGPA